MKSEADRQFEATAKQRKADRLKGIREVKSVYGAPLPRFGHYKIK